MADEVPASKPGASLAARTALSFGWVFAWRMLSRILGIASTLILVRILLPADFGLIALAMSITHAVEMMSALGVQDAVVRHPNPTRAVYDTAFTMGVLRALANAVLIAAIAWPMAIFFDDMRLVPIVLAAALGLVITGCENIGVVEFRRDLKYDRDLVLRLIPRLLGMAATIGIAFAWQTYWALVAGGLVIRIAGTALSYSFHPHRPRLTLAAWRDLTGFSIWVWLSSLVGLVRDRAEVFVVGRVMGPSAVGTFSVTVEIAVMPMTELIQPLATVLFSTFSRAARDDGESRELYLRFLGLAGFVTIPAGVGIGLLADPMTHVLLGPNWTAAIPVLQVMAVVNALTTFGFLSRAVLEARGRMTIIFSVNLVVGIVRLVAGIALVSWFGLLGAAIGAMIGSTVDQSILWRATCRTLDMSWLRIAARLWRPVLGAAVMAAAIVGAGYHVAPPSTSVPGQIVLMVATAVAGAAVYSATVLLAWLACGRPAGPETDLWGTGRASLSRLGARFRGEPLAR